MFKKFLLQTQWCGEWPQKPPETLAIQLGIWLWLQVLSMDKHQTVCNYALDYIVETTRTMELS